MNISVNKLGVVGVGLILASLGLGGCAVDAQSSESLSEETAQTEQSLINSAPSNYYPLGTPGGWINVEPNTPVAWGINDNYSYALKTGWFQCISTSFPSDPAPRAPEACSRLAGTWAADEYGMIDTSAPAGAGSGWWTLYFGTGLDNNYLKTTGSVGYPKPCTIATFGGDPAWSKRKHCWKKWNVLH